MPRRTPFVDQYNAPMGGTSDYTAATAEELVCKQAEWEASRAKPVCTCRNSVFALDIDLCPVHGTGCT